jgi:rare lipoprotein A
MAPLEPGTLLAGRASWYGPGFAGRTTACGGVFDPNALTLASRELRCGTVVRVTGPTGVSIQATVTDWGPAEWTHRRFDLSAATFAAIHHPGAGVIDVHVEVLGTS